MVRWWFFFICIILQYSNIIPLRYAAQAWRAVNQAIGRVIRHRWDYAAIVLLDERFCADERSVFLSKWLQPYVYCVSLVVLFLMLLSHAVTCACTVSMPRLRCL